MLVSSCLCVCPYLDKFKPMRKTTWLHVKTIDRHYLRLLVKKNTGRQYGPRVAAYERQK